MKHTIFVLLAVLLFSACAREPVESNPTRGRLHLEFLSREGCKNTAAMLENLDVVIADGKISADYTVILQATLQPDDPRTGYPTPTILLNGKDVFGMASPTPPFPEPS